MNRVYSLKFKDMKTMAIMKAMKLVLIVFGLVSVLGLSAQMFAEQPSMQMHSTSTMMGSGSELPQAAVTGTYTTYSTGVGSGYISSGPQKGAAEGDTPPADPDGPMQEPLGDTPWMLMLLLVAGYTLCAWRRTTKTTDSHLATRDSKLHGLSTRDSELR